MAFGREYFEVERLDFVMPRGIRNTARGPQPEVKAVVLGNASFVTVDDSGNFLRQGGRFRFQTKGSVVAHLVVRHADKDRAANQQEQRQPSRDRRDAGAQINSADSFFGSYCLHRTY